jgi:hypothetical protein
VQRAADQAIGNALHFGLGFVAMNDAPHGFREGDKVWVEDGEGRHHPGIFVADNESSGWFGGGPSAYVVHPEAKQAEVVSTFRITPRDE